MEPHRRVTLRDIAGAANVHFTTVSLALRNDPRLLLETRKRIQALARSLGYIPDPMLASLSSYRREIRPPSYRGTIAWITNYPTESGWRKWKIFRGFFQGAENQAQQLGYKLEEFWVRATGMTTERSSYILRSRGIDGLLIAPQPPNAPPINLEWEHFSSVALGYSLRSPALNVACNHQSHSIKLAMRTLLARGYGRIGFTALATISERVDDNWLAGFLAEQFRLPRSARLPPLMLGERDAPAVTQWIRRHKPDAIITDQASTIDLVRRCGLRVPQDVGVAFMGDPELGGPYAGIDEMPKDIGSGAMKMVVNMIRHSERGIPSRRKQLLFEGKWVDGASARAAATEEKSAARKSRAGAPMKKGGLVRPPLARTSEE